MRVTCPDCGCQYDDAFCWAICPHNPLDRRFDERLCLKHDLFSCHLCRDAAVDAACQIEGWMEDEELAWLYETVMGLKDPVTVVEIGSFLGRSSAALAAAVAKIGGRLHCIDTWDAAGTCREQEIRAKGPDWLYAGFLSNMIWLGVSQAVKSIRGSSHAQAIVDRFADGSVDMLFVDGRHDYHHVKKDLELWAPKVKAGGVISGHDFHPDWPGVVRAVEEHFEGKVVRNPVVGIWEVRV